MNPGKRLHRQKFPPLDNVGQGLVEYSILLMLVAMVIFVALQGLGATLDTEYYDPISAAVTNAGR